MKTFREYLAEGKVEKEVNEASNKQAKIIVDKLDLRSIINIIDAELDKVNDRDDLYSNIIEELLNKLNKSIK